MPGVNTTGRPNANDIWLGRGKILLGKINTTTGKPYDMRHVGNCKSLTLSTETETLEHQNSRSGIKVIDREIVLSQKYTVNMILDELSFDNLALAFSGDASTGVANPASSASLTDHKIADNAQKGRWYDVVNGSGGRLYDLRAAAVTIKAGAGAATNTLVLGTDYEIDLTWGRVFIRPESSTFVNDHELYISYTGGGTGSGTTSERTLDSATIATRSKESYFLSYVGINPANDDQEMLLNLHSVSLRIDGDMPLIGDEFSELTLTGTAEKNELGYPTKPVGEFLYHAGA